MIRSFVSALALGALLAVPAVAETHEVKMLNKGEEGRMVFEPAFLRISEGDTVRFLATDKGHNAESIDGMTPDGTVPFAGKINEEIEVTLDTTGVYGVMCKPHYAMGMVMTIAVGDVAEPHAGFLEGRIPRKAMERFEGQLSNL